MLYAVSGYEWGDTDISFSYVPDGTDVEGYSSTLFSKLDTVAPTEVWQREFARALQTWSNVSTLNFREVADDGSPSELANVSQGDGRFGDIRLAAHPLDGPLAYAYYPSGYWGITGDVFLSTQFTFQIGSTYDLYSVLLHETGHSLGLGHAAGSVMNANYQEVVTSLTADDINGIQSLYGARQDDVFDLNGRNDSLGTASSLVLDSAGQGLFAADLTAMDDTDYYAFVAPSDADGSLNVSVDTSGLSLLAPLVTLYDATGSQIAMADVGDAYGTMATIQFNGAVAGETYYLMADGSTADAFGMGAYRLDVDFGVTEGGGDPEPPSVALDRFESNDTLLTATGLGRLNNRTESGLTLHSATDVDMFHFSARKGGTFRITTDFTSASSYEITAYDANMNVLAQATGSSVQISLAGGEGAFVEIQSLAAETDAYDLVFERVSGTGGGGGGSGGGQGKGQKGPGKLQPDMYFATVADEVAYSSRHGAATSAADLSGILANRASQSSTQPGFPRSGLRLGSTSTAKGDPFLRTDAPRIALNSWSSVSGYAMDQVNRSIGSNRLIQADTPHEKVDAVWGDAVEAAFSDQAFTAVGAVA